VQREGKRKEIQKVSLPSTDHTYCGKHMMGFEKHPTLQQLVFSWSSQLQSWVLSLPLLTALHACLGKTVDLMLRLTGPKIL
jgi:hypothetical protein